MATRIAPTPRVGRKRERTRGELVAAAERLVAVRGVDAVSIDDITAAADVAKGTFYTHFRGKSDLAAAVARRVRRELEDEIARVNHGTADAPRRMANALACMLGFAIAHPIRARAMLRLQPGVVDPDAPINAGVRSDVARGIKQKRLRAPSLPAALLTTIGAAMAAIVRLSDAEHRPQDPYGLSAEVIATVLAALGVRRDEATRLAHAAVRARREGR